MTGIVHGEQYGVGNRLMRIGRAWRGSSCRLFSPALWMNDEELEAIAARVKNTSAADIVRAVQLAESAGALFDACQAVHVWSQGSDKERTECSFAFQIEPKLQAALKGFDEGFAGARGPAGSFPNNIELRSVAPGPLHEAAAEVVVTIGGNPAPNAGRGAVKTRRLKIEADGDVWNNRIKPKIRLMGKWLEAAGFIPGRHVTVACIENGVIELRCIQSAHTPVKGESRLAETVQ